VALDCLAIGVANEVTGRFSVRYFSSLVFENHDDAFRNGALFVTLCVSNRPESRRHMVERGVNLAPCCAPDAVPKA
jgi:hypothetical protein